ncbi:MAG: HEPN domain-containing protein [Campylobacterales bacterium]|nr:HEPN domain-containing protein [Campylobacterales bacterium]
MNEKAAREWLAKAWHNLSGARLFYEANHYTDVTAVELHYAVEKILKSLLAYQNAKIPKTHELVDISLLVREYIELKKEKYLLDQISSYHIEESYPQFARKLPPNEEIKEVLDFKEQLFNKVCDILEIDKEELK